MDCPGSLREKFIRSFVFWFWARLPVHIEVYRWILARCGIDRGTVCLNMVNPTLVRCEERIGGRVADGRQVASAIGFPKQIAAPNRARIRFGGADLRGFAAALDNVVSEGRVGRAETVGAMTHLVVNFVVDECIERDDAVIRTIVARELCPIGDLPVSIADGNRDGVSVEIIAEDLVPIAENSD